MKHRFSSEIKWCATTIWRGCLVMLLAFIVCGQTAHTCHSFEYVLKTDKGEECCPKCIPGHRVQTDCTEFQSTSCTACDGGTYMDKLNGEKQCHQCLNCTEGTGLRKIRSCTIKENAVCEPKEGFFCVNGSVDRCVAAQRHSRCAPGQYISRAGTSSTDTECVSCSEGTFSDGTFTSCQPHKRCSRLQAPGTVYSDSVCLESLTPGEVAGLVAGILLLIILCGLVFCFIKHCEKCNYRVTGAVIPNQVLMETYEDKQQNRFRCPYFIQCQP